MNPALDPDAGHLHGPADPALLTPPLSWWRILPPEGFGLSTQHRLRAALLTAPLLPSPDWDAACRADPTAALGVAVTALAEAVALPWRLDPAMSAVCLCAALGDAICIDLLVHVLGRRARRRADLDALCLAQAWQFASRRGLGCDNVSAR
jgi:hypothetical protein